MEARSDRPLVYAGLRGFLELGRFDVIAVIALVTLAFGLRFASPIFPDFLSGSGAVNASGVGFETTPSTGAGAEPTLVPVGPPGVVGGVKVSHIDVEITGFVFDEVYFPVDAAKDLRQPAESYFDPEPPLAKLLMAPPIAIFGFNSWTWRLSTTIFGSLLVGLMYLVALRLRRDRFFALVTALFICFDGLAFVESRTGVIDIIAIFFVALFYYAFLLHWQARTRAQWRTTLYVMAGIAGLAFAAKLTALAPLVVAAGLIVIRGIAPYLAAFIPWLRRIAGPGRAETIMWRQAAGPRALLHYIAGGLIALAIFGASLLALRDDPAPGRVLLHGVQSRGRRVTGDAEDTQRPGDARWVADGTEPRRGDRQHPADHRGVAAISRRGMSQPPLLIAVAHMADHGASGALLRDIPAQ